MTTAYPGYNERQFQEDLRRRTPKKKCQTKSPLARVGRYRRMQQMVAEFERSGNMDMGRQAMALRKRITQYYTVRTRIGNVITEIYFHPVTSIETVERFTAAARLCKNTD